MLRLQSQESKNEKKQQKKGGQCVLKGTHLYSKPYNTVLNYMRTQHLFFFQRTPTTATINHCNSLVFKEPVLI